MRWQNAERPLKPDPSAGSLSGSPFLMLCKTGQSIISGGYP